MVRENMWVGRVGKRKKDALAAAADESKCWGTATDDAGNITVTRVRGTQVYKRAREDTPEWEKEEALKLALEKALRDQYVEQECDKERANQAVDMAAHSAADDAANRDFLANPNTNRESQQAIWTATITQYQKVAETVKLEYGDGVSELAAMEEAAAAIAADRETEMKDLNQRKDAGEGGDIRQCSHDGEGFEIDTRRRCTKNICSCDVRRESRDVGEHVGDAGSDPRRSRPIYNVGQSPESPDVFAVMQ